MSETANAVATETDRQEAGAAEAGKSYPFVTIDSESTVDIDDALYVERQEAGYLVVIAIANPTKLVPVGSTEDQQAQLLAATAYVRDKAVLRMLPRGISEDRGSLVADKERDAVVFKISLAEDLSVTGVKISPEKIKVAHRLSYTEIPGIIKDESHPCREMLSLASGLATMMLKERRHRGALAFYDLSRLLLTDEEGNLQILHSTEDVVGQILIQEMMILTNHVTARYMVEHNIPCILRNHEPLLATPPANELASTIEAWVHGVGFNAEQALAKFAALTGRARYAAVAKGHYSLNLPFYAHISSPLRRYADLVNMRQLVAYVGKRKCPYAQDQLVAMAEGLNEALDRRKQERSEGFKNVVKDAAARAMSRGTLSKLADHELRQAVKLSRDAGYLPQDLIDELVERFKQAKISDSLADTLLIEVPIEFIGADIRAALAAWLLEYPPRAMHMWLHALQVEFLSKGSISVAEAEGKFMATATAERVGGEKVEGRASAGKKREAEQLAAAQVIFSVMGIDAPTVVTAAAGQGAKAETSENYKGRLLELCQQRKWAMPAFESNGKGPSHAMVFSATVSLTIGGEKRVGQSNGTSSKREAEMWAAHDLLRQIEALAPPAAPKPTASATGNPVGTLQEMAQKGKFRMPEYALKQITETPPLFSCTVTVFGPEVERSYVGEGSTKQAAKTQSAMKALGS